MAYYERQCAPDMRELYGTLFRGVSELESSVRIPMLSAEKTGEVYSRLRLDHPEIFYLSGYHIRCMRGADHGEFIPEYLFEKSKIISHRQAIRTRIERITRGIKDRSETEKIRFLNSFIAENVRYDKLKKQYSHEIIGPLTQGVGVCEGIAKSVKVLADALGLECIVVLSRPEAGKKYGHAWNIIKRSGRWYHLDATFDLSLSRCGETRWDYFLLADQQVYRDHVKPVYPVPECSDNGSFYYREQKMSFTKEEGLAKRITQYAKKKPRMVFHWRDGYLTREKFKELMKVIASASAEAGRYIEVTLNWPQAVFAVSFSDAPKSVSEPVLEKADESEEDGETDIC